MDTTHGGTAAQALDEIHKGGQNLILAANQRLAEIKHALDNGRFHEAFTVCSSLQEKVGHLAAAQGALGRLACARIIAVRALEPGMNVLDAGVVSQVAPCENCGRDDCDNVTLTFENGHSVSLDCDAEVAVAE